MTFEWPLGLLAFAVLPLVLILWFLARRRQARYAIRFSNVGILAQVVESTRSPWRFVPPVLLLAALAALAVGMARPQVDVTAERKQGTVVLALDRSGSMLAQDVDPDRMTASRKAASKAAGSAKFGSCEATAQSSCSLTRRPETDAILASSCTDGSRRSSLACRTSDRDPGRAAESVPHSSSSCAK